MSEKRQFPRKALVFVVVALAALAFVAGCEEEPTVQQQSQAEDHAAMDHQPQADAALVVQETCPIMGGPINEQIFVEHQGKKVYFCCAGCPEKFLENPEKYVAELPQFQQ